MQLFLFNFSILKSKECYCLAIITVKFVNKKYFFENILDISTSHPDLTKVDNLKYNDISKKTLSRGGAVW